MIPQFEASAKDNSQTENADWREQPEVVATRTELKEKYASNGLVIVLDPGHDSTHGGASYYGLREEELNYKIATYCKQELEQYIGVTVYMTRSGMACPNGGGNNGPCLQGRVNTAASLGADILVSIHLNANSDTNISGSEIYYPNNHYTSSLSSKGLLLSSKILEKLRELGLVIRGALIRNSTDSDVYPDGSVTDYYAIIRNAKYANITGIIVEHAFMTNANDVNRFMKSEEGLKSLGVADAKGIADYYGLCKGDYRGAFDAEYYEQQYPDLKKAYGNDTAKLLEHFLQHGIDEGRKASPAFDINYYKKNNADLQKAYGDDNIKYLEHFVMHGMEERRRASAEFDVMSYRRQYADLRHVYRKDYKEYYIHYTEHGKAEGRKGTGCTVLKNPITIYNGVDYASVYDYAYYINKYPDIKKAYADDDIEALTHYVQQGIYEGRQAIASFNIQSYRNRYPDLREGYKENTLGYILHYINYGKAERRVATGYENKIIGAATTYKGIDYSPVYDYNYYVSKYPDIKKAFGYDDKAVLEHFVNHGIYEGRQAIASFNIQSYRNRYSDLRRGYKDNTLGYVHHYINYGKAEGRVVTGYENNVVGAITTYNGVDYSAVYEYAYYTNKYPDIKKAYGFDDVAVLEHFVNHGMAEGRQGKSSFDVHKYQMRYEDLNRAYGNDFKALYMHYLQHGIREGRSAS